jgi:hypothetical protein
VSAPHMPINLHLVSSCLVSSRLPSFRSHFFLFLSYSAHLYIYVISNVIGNVLNARLFAKFANVFAFYGLRGDCIAICTSLRTH